MKFVEALSELSKGNYVTRTGWQDGSYLALLPSMTYVWKVAVVPNPAAGNWLPFMADMLADDWITQDKSSEDPTPASPAKEASVGEEPATPEAA